MYFSTLRRSIVSAFRSASRRKSPGQRRFIPTLDYLEERNLLTAFVYTESTVGGLIADINTANADTNAADTYTINLTNGTYSFSGADNGTDGGNAVPVITSSNLTIVGNGSTLTRTGAAPYRFFDVASGATLDLQSMTLSNGLASGATAQGGALLDHGGNVTLSHVTLEVNKAAGGTGQSAQGGALYLSGGTVNVSQCTIAGNDVTGGSGGIGAVGGNAQGGGIYANGVTLTVTGGSVSGAGVTAGNGGAGIAGTSANPNGGAGGAGGNVQGGGIYAHGGKLTLNGVSVFADLYGGNGGNGGAGFSSATTPGQGGAGGQGGLQEGGGVFASQVTTLTIKNGAAVNGSTAHGNTGGSGGNAGQGKTGGAGAAAGFLAGGGVFANGGNVIISGASTGISENSLLAGEGGFGGGVASSGPSAAGVVGGAGGAGGNAFGGGLYALGASVTFTGGTSLNIGGTVGINANAATGGRGGNGGAAGAGAMGGNGGAGGSAQGGGVFLSGASSLTSTFGSLSANALLSGNTATGGGGGTGGLGYAATAAVGGAGGLATGGGVTVRGETLNLKNATLVNNVAIGGQGGDGGLNSKSSFVGNFGAGGNAQGGGLFLGSSTTTLLNTTDYGNIAEAGTGVSSGTAAGSAKYGQGGTAQGGAVFATNSTVTALNSTFAVNLLAAGTAVTNGSHHATGGTAQGGGIYSANGSFSLVNDTLEGNGLVAYTDRGAVAGQGGGVFNGANNTLNLENTIIALDQIFGNSATGESSGTGTTYNDLAGAAPTQNDANILGDGLDANATDANMVYGGSQQLFAVTPTTKTFGSYTVQGQVPANFGGLTYTLPLSWTAPAISQGDPSAASTLAAAEGVATTSATDQRGLPRVLDGKMDVGATQAQLSITGSVSSATATPGGTLTYTFTITNGEATQVSGTLTDTLPSNATFSASNGSNWTSSGGTASTAFAVAANSTQQFTLIVNVSASAPASAVLTNTATIAPTGNPTGTRSTSQVSTVPGQTTTDITSKVTTLHTPAFRDFFRGANAYDQGVLLINNSGTTYTGPIALVLTGLPSDVTLTNASGTYNGSPYIDIVPANGTWRPGFFHFLVTILEFNTTKSSDIHYVPQIVQGI